MRTITLPNRRHGLLLAFFIAVGALLLSACATSGKYPEAPRTVDFKDYQYKISVLDTLNILVWRNADLSSTVTVRPDGRISTPLVEDVVAVGRTPVELAREVEKALAKFIRDPVVTIMVSGYQSATASQVRVAGEVPKPQAVQYRPDMSLLDVMIQAGGMTEFADGNGSVLVRGAEGGKVYSLRLKDLLKRGDVSANVAVIPGDIVIVPQTAY